MTHIRGDAVGDARAQLDERGPREEPLLDELLHEPEVTGVENLQFRLDAKIAQNACPLAQIIGRRNVGAVAVAEVERTAVKGCDVRPIQPLVAEVDDMAHAILLAYEISPRRRRVGHALITDADV